MYRDNIGLNDKYNFGVEIEFSRANLLKLYKIISGNCIPVELKIKHKRGYPIFDKWFLDIDSTVTESDGEVIKGGELSSRILTDKKKCWSEIKNICNILVSNGGRINDKCGLHVNVDIAKSLENPLFLETLIKLFFVYENDINLFFMGDYYDKRSTKDKYAYSFSKRIIPYIDNKEFYKTDCPGFDIGIQKGVLNKWCGLNLEKVDDKKILEVRYGNGTLDPEIIQNFCNFVLKVIHSIDIGKIDLDFLDYEIARIKSDPLFEHNFNNCIGNIDSFLSLLEDISLNLDDYEDMSYQYLKVLYNKK